MNQFRQVYLDCIALSLSYFQLHGSCIEKILPAIDRLLKILDDNAADDGKDYTIYTGAAGKTYS